jgi:hypothetical protein
MRGALICTFRAALGTACLASVDIPRSPAPMGLVEQVVISLTITKSSDST